MSRFERLLEAFDARGDDECLMHRGERVSYRDLDRKRRRWIERLDCAQTKTGDVVAIQADFSPDSIALLFALLSRGNVAALLPRSAPREADLLNDACARSLWREAAPGNWSYEELHSSGDHPLLQGLRERRGSGFVIFSSGSTGRAKAILHDIDRFLAKFDGPGKALRTLAFLLFDHIAGLDTLFYTLCHGGSLVLTTARDPRAVAELLERTRVEVLPTSPTFLNLFSLARAHEGRDLSSLKIITYGSEPMAPETLARAGRMFPEAKIIQKYGTSEFGSPRSRSRERGSLWMSLAEDDLEVRIVDGLMWLRSDSAMLGYLNAPNPIDEEGWYCTGDLVEQDGAWIRILGRESELINVGGEKVFPAEVEQVIAELGWVQDVVVRGAEHPLTGQVVEAIVNLAEPKEPRELRKLVRSHCRDRLAPYKIPARVQATSEALTTTRHKKRRRPLSPS